MQNVNIHPCDKLPQNIKQCLDVFVWNTSTDSNAKCHTVRVIGRLENPISNDNHNVHIVVASQNVQRSLLQPCSSVHDRTEVLRCVVFVLIDAGILSVKRFTRAEQARQALQARRDVAFRCLGAASRLTDTIKTATLTHFCLAMLVFLLNLPGAFLTLCLQLVPCVACFSVLCIGRGFEEEVVKAIILIVLFYVIGSLAVVSIVPNVELQITITCLFILPTLYILGWMIIANKLLTTKYNCKYGIWSLPRKLWSTEFRIPNCFKIAYIPIIIFNYLLLSLFVCPMGLFFIVAHITTKKDRYRLTTLLQSGLFFNIHVLGSEALLVIVGLIFLNLSTLSFVGISIAILIYFVSFSLLDSNSIDDICAQYEEFFAFQHCNKF